MADRVGSLIEPLCALRQATSWHTLPGCKLVGEQSLVSAPNLGRTVTTVCGSNWGGSPQQRSTPGDLLPVKAPARFIHAPPTHPVKATIPSKPHSGKPHSGNPHSWNPHSAEGGTRTHTPLGAPDFESGASAIPPPRQTCRPANRPPLAGQPNRCSGSNRTAKRPTFPVAERGSPTPHSRALPPTHALPQQPLRPTPQLAISASISSASIGISTIRSIGADSVTRMSFSNRTPNPSSRR
jgi:hypothetical protein